MEKTLQDICREAKEYQHLTTQDLADLTDLSSSTISNYFSASSKDPSLYKMGLIWSAPGLLSNSKLTGYSAAIFSSIHA